METLRIADESSLADKTKSQNELDMEWENDDFLTPTLTVGTAIVEGGSGQTKAQGTMIFNPGLPSGKTLGQAYTFQFLLVGDRGSFGNLDYGTLPRGWQSGGSG